MEHGQDQDRSPGLERRATSKAMEQYTNLCTSYAERVENPTRFPKMSQTRERNTIPSLLSLQILTLIFKGPFLWALLVLPLGAITLQHLSEARERKRAAGEVYSYKPRTKDIYKLVEDVSVCDAIYGGIDREAEQKDISDVAGTSEDVSGVFYG